MHIMMVGLSHKTAGIAIREAMGFTPQELPHALAELKEHERVLECAIVSTCNRVEVYAVIRKERSAAVAADIKRFLRKYHSCKRPRFEDTLYTYLDGECIRHMLSVAAGLDSLVCGETEITCQIKDAYERARQAKAAGTILHALFQTALRTSKEVRTHTGISRRPVSVSSVAVDLAEKLMKNIAAATVLILGAGKTSELTLRYLASKGVRSVIVSNRSYERAQKLAHEVNGKAIHYDEFLDVLPSVDIVISSTAAPHVVVTAPEVRDALAKRKRKNPLLFIDIAVPRDIAPDVQKLPNVFLYNIDDLKSVADENMKERHKEIIRGTVMIEKKTEEFVCWLSSRAVQPTIVRLQRKTEDIRLRELQKTLRRLKNISPKEREEIEYLTKRISRQFLHPFIKRLKGNAASSPNRAYLHTINELFSRDEGDKGGNNG